MHGASKLTGRSTPFRLSLRPVSGRTNSGADILFVCLGAPKQEEFMYKYKGEIGTGLCCGFGGTLDIIAGTAKRAPDIFIKLGLEWLYRLLKQPSRFVRMLALPKFLLGTVFFGKRPIKK